MKRLFFVFVSVTLTITSFAGKINSSSVPAAVRSAFSKNFSGVNDVKWEKEKGNYEANFKQANKTMSALFNEKGEWLETETGIKINDLPANVLSYISANYKGAKIKETAQIKKANGAMQYEAEVKGKDIIFDDRGNFIKEEKD